jgi:hypothetical protein
MRIVLPWTGICEASRCDKSDVRDAVEATGREIDWRHVGKADRDYFDLLSELWNEGEAFCIVEHDIVIHPTALDELDNCSHDWCGFPHEYMGCGLQWGLGCVKFGADLIARNPDAMLRVAVMSDATHDRRHWCRLDAWLQGCILPNAGETKHQHETVVRHLGRGCAHGCI